MKRLDMMKGAVVLAAVGLAGAAVSADQPAAYEKLLAQTEEAVEKAASVNGEWRDIRWKKSKIQYLPSAKKAAADGDYAEAMKLLETAKFQAEMGYAQALEQKDAGPRF